MKFSICIEPVLENVDFYDRFKIAKDIGYDAVEFWEPEKFDAKKLAEASVKANIPIVGMTIFDTRVSSVNLPWRALKDNFIKTIEYGKEAGCKNYIALTGYVQSKGDSQKMAIVENLKRMGEIAEKEGVQVVVECLNSMTDHLGYYLDNAYEGFDIIRAVGSDNIKLLFDIYHMQLMQGNLTDSICQNVQDIGHIHSAGVPGRHEHMDTEVNYPALIKKIEAAGYDKYFGLEYFPTYDNAQSLADCLAYLKS